jgi:hypothetical protein
MCKLNKIQMKYFFFLSTKKFKLTQYRIATEYRNSYTLWKKMDSPQNPSREQILVLIGTKILISALPIIRLNKLMVMLTCYMNLAIRTIVLCVTKVIGVI